VCDLRALRRRFQPHQREPPESALRRERLCVVVGREVLREVDVDLLCLVVDADQLGLLLLDRRDVIDRDRLQAGAKRAIRVDARAEHDVDVGA
jgi:hypothetical protein